ncbi:BURP domain-containing protein [Prunus dulcis]|uniref:BURP domain-containing protein n=1 Tax=Prunus dulcis TaxID=3755 RepID=A0A4Y1QRC0_PRUDU|nr:BURP domain-containing protein [Prunus dulcis]
MLLNPFAEVNRPRLVVFPTQFLHKTAEIQQSSTIALNFLKMLKTSDLNCMKYTQHILVQSSMKVKKYLFHLLMWSALDHKHLNEPAPEADHRLAPVVVTTSDSAYSNGQTYYANTKLLISILNQIPQLVRFEDCAHLYSPEIVVASIEDGSTKLTHARSSHVRLDNATFSWIDFTTPSLISEPSLLIPC